MSKNNLHRNKSIHLYTVEYSQNQEKVIQKVVKNAN